MARTEPRALLDQPLVLARAGIADYWIVNLGARAVEVRRRPGQAPEAPYGWRYLAVEIFGEADAVTPLAASHAHIAVADLLP